MPREEIDESLYRRPEGEKTAFPGTDGAAPEQASGAAPEKTGDKARRRSAWDDSEPFDEEPKETAAPKSRRKFMPDDDEMPEDMKPDAPEDGKTEEGDGGPEEDVPSDEDGKGSGKKDKIRKRPSAGSREESKNDRKGRRITSGNRYFGQERDSGLRRVLVWGLCALLFVVVAMMALSNFMDSAILDAPGSVVGRIITPVQRFFSDITESVSSYVRTLKVRGEIEYRYGQLLVQLDDLASQAAMAEEYKHQVDQLYDLMDEMQRNTDLDPISASVIGHDTGNYFSVLTIDVGTRQGVRDNMAVVFSGGLVGYTYDTEETVSKVLCIIDGDATVAAMVQSTRDQGSVKGTLSIDGTAMCRMYYLPDDSLPRPGDLITTSGVGVEFPKGIPIGYVRESTRGMDENKSYIVVEPIVDFQHLEYVVVYRYRPAYTESVQKRASAAEATLIPLSSPRPQPTFQVGEGSQFSTPTPNPGATETPVPTASPTPAPEATPEATEGPEGTPYPENLSYQAPENVGGTPTPSPSPSPTPTPTPMPLFDPARMTVEDE